jgi:hypothetical protein
MRISWEYDGRSWGEDLNDQQLSVELWVTLDFQDLEDFEGGAPQFVSVTRMNKFNISTTIKILKDP